MRSVLRPVTQADSADMLAWRNMERVRNFVFEQGEIKPEDHALWFEKMLNSCDQAYYVYCEKEAARGVIGFSGLQTGVGHWGFYTTPGAPAGTGAKMLRVALDFAFETLSLHRVEAEVLDYNTASLKLHDRLGFERIGMRHNHRLRDGSFHVVILFAKEAPKARQEKK
ncbi:MAG: UDP-4-amino-4,6-dideoxy-N-acetyl-beta-L-altrosamine N-acetyltransferase [Pseudomonadota bacterium]